MSIHVYDYEITIELEDGRKLGPLTVTIESEYDQDIEDYPLQAAAAARDLLKGASFDTVQVGTGRSVSFTDEDIEEFWA